MQAPQPSPKIGASPQDLFTSLNATLVGKHLERSTTPVRHIQEDDYAVPAPPPPSPVSFRSEHWPSSIRR
jgi:hypothetical protein